MAKLAGIPRNVIRGASKVLEKLEERAAQTDDRQLDLFCAPAEPQFEPASEEKETELNELLDKIEDIDLDDLSPRQAWEALAELQKAAKQFR